MNIAVACKIVSRLGGALNRTPKERPGAETLVAGLTRFRDILVGYRLGASGDPPFFSQ